MTVDALYVLGCPICRRERGQASRRAGLGIRGLPPLTVRTGPPPEPGRCPHGKVHKRVDSPARPDDAG
ncbi:hypothetical protein [Frankia sp. CcI49]|uniref:hypothetical protein n=1 Tax=Frankia sp. CcI49 TaxID=1745382 RepID=UPI00105451CB|nr:hypothetical protein [Frankia sp. CcI49]